MDKKLKIKTRDATIYGKLRGSIEKPLVIIVHGLPCNMDEYFYKSAAIWFSQHGFSSFRFNLYDWQKNARQLIDCSLDTHASDLDSVVRYFRKKGVKKIFVTGHSYGGPTILLSKKQDFDAVALWDPSYRISFIQEKYGAPAGVYLKQVKGYFMQWGVDVVLGEKMAKEVDTLEWDQLTSRFTPPIHILAAGKGILMKGAKSYFKTANEPKKLTIIDDATHYFDDKDGMQEEVFRASKEWFERYI